MKPVYYLDGEIGNFHYGTMHPMKPHRMRMTDSLIHSYGLNNHLRIISNSNRVIDEEQHFTKFHTDDYIEFLKNVTPENVNEHIDSVYGFNLGEDCPVFDGLYDFCKKYTAGSLMGATYINEGQTNIAINWTGGLHHAKRREASGFCYVNDCVLAILELLRKYRRVLYTDIDIHHGDGVEEAFYTTDRVLTFSVHKFGNYFPDTGNSNDIGTEKGDGYSLNFPLNDGMDDASYLEIYKPVVA